VNLLSFLKEMTALLTRTLPESIHIELTAEDDDYQIETDISRLQQVFLNLALNARDAMPDGGSLHFQLEQVTVRPGESPLPELLPGAWLRVTVTDSGTGIEPDILPRIFDPFFTTKSPTHGTGLGLAQVYGIIKQHGGEIAVTSEVGVGTTFTIYLPATSLPESPENVLPSSQPGQSQGGRILVVEDQEALRFAIQEILEESGYQVVTAVNGREAVTLFEAEHPTIDLVLSDMVMPEMGGMELLRTLQTIQPSTKMILCTGYPLQEADKESLRQRVIPWLQKPFFGTTLIETIRAVLEGQPIQ
jgi:two-component system, cell cycle sensor histidine kinase and response regulator CckA